MYGNNTRKILCVAISISNQQNSVSLFIFYVFSSTKLEEGRTGSVSGAGGGTPGRGDGERGRRMNMIHIIYTHVYKCKNDTC
jgi:hypothetical protein